jgi:hypothetical protein
MNLIKIRIGGFMFTYLTSFRKTSHCEIENVGNKYLSDLKTFKEESKDIQSRYEKGLEESRRRILNSFDQPPHSSSPSSFRGRGIAQTTSLGAKTYFSRIFKA